MGSGREESMGSEESIKVVVCSHKVGKGFREALKMIGYAIHEYDRLTLYKKVNLFMLLNRLSNYEVAPRKRKKKEV